jgi:hypothetical protein
VANGIRVRQDRVLAIVDIVLEKMGGKGAVMQQDVVQAGAQVSLYFPNDVGSAKSVGFSVFCHQIADIHCLRPRVADGLGNALHKEVGQDAGGEIAGTNNNEVGLCNGVNGLLAGGCLRLQVYTIDSRQWAQDTLATPVNFCLTVDVVPILQLGA